MSDFKDRITKESTDFEKEFLTIYDGSLWTALNRMRYWKSPDQYDALTQQVSSLTIENEKLKADKPLVAVPQFVAEWLENKSAYTIATSYIPKEVLKWSQGNTGFSDVAVNISNLIEIKVTGYTVKKEQLFILKHIDMSELSTDDSLYLAHGIYKKLQHVTLSKDVDVHNIAQLHFTKSEIDELNIGSYEQIEVDQ